MHLGGHSRVHVPRILNVWTGPDGGGNAHPGRLLVRNGRSSAWSDWIAADAARFDDAFSVDLADDVEVLFQAEPPRGWIEVLYEFE